MGWIEDRWHDLTRVGSGTWMAIAVWVVVAFAVLALLVVQRQLSRARRLKAQQTRPHVEVFMEPHAADWHLVEFVVRNFGQRAAYNVRLAFNNPPTVAEYEHAHDGMVDIAELQLPEELPELAPGQEWRTVWDSALDRHQLGGSIASRFSGSVIYYDSPAPTGRRQGLKAWRRKPIETKVVLDWDTLPPVQRIELMTTHDLAKREKQKLELLRTVLTYFHVASQEIRPEDMRAEIDRLNAATQEIRNRWRSRQFEPTEVRVRRTDTDRLPSAEPFPPVAADPDQGRHHNHPTQPPTGPTGAMGSPGSV